MNNFLASPLFSFLILKQVPYFLDCFSNSDTYAFFKNIGYFYLKQNHRWKYDLEKENNYYVESI